MIINLDIHNSLDKNKSFVDIKVDNHSSKFECFDIMNHDAIETLELQLTEIVQKLYDYRKQQEQQQND